MDKFRWSIEIEGFSRSGFSAVEVPKMSINTQSYAEGGAHMTPRQIIDSVQFRPITLTRGVTGDGDFYDWVKAPFKLYRGDVEVGAQFTGNVGLGDFSTSKPIRSGEYRRNVVISHLDRSGRAIKQYILYDAFPIEFEPASDFSADGDDTYSMEKIVLAYESFEVVNNGQSTNPFSISDVLKRVSRRVV